MFLQAEAESAQNVVNILETIHKKLKDAQNEEENEDMHILYSLKSLDAFYLRKDLSWLLQVARDSKDNLLVKYKQSDSHYNTLFHIGWTHINLWLKLLWWQDYPA